MLYSTSVARPAQAMADSGSHQGFSAAKPKYRHSTAPRLALELTPKAATGEWRFLQTVQQKGTALAGTKRMTVLAGQKRFSA